MQPGDRLPSSRELAAEFDVDHRIVLAACRLLEEDGVLELRARGGIYIAARAEGSVTLPSFGWMTDLLVQGIKREIPIGEFHEWFRRGVETLRWRVLVVQHSADQIAGLCRELTDYYGLTATGFAGGRLVDGGEPPMEMRAADLILTTGAFEHRVRPFAERLGKRLIVVEVRSDLISEEWRLLLKRKVYVVVRDESFFETVTSFFAGTPGAENLVPIVLDRDSVDQIPEGAPVYITSSARESLGSRKVPGRVLPAPRFLSTSSAQELVRVVVETNLRAFGAISR